MEPIEELLSTLIPALDSHDVGSWEPSKVDLLCRLLKEYSSQERASKAGKSTNAANDAADKSEDEEDDDQEEEEEEEDEEDEEALFVQAIGEVDEGLGRIRDFLQNRLPYGETPEPTQIPNSQTTTAAAEATSKKRARSPNAEEQLAASAAALVPTPVYAVDSFLYSEDDIEELVEQKKIAREYCTRCGCTDIRLAEFITHSFSRDQLLFLSCFLFPHLLRRFLSASAKMQAEAGKTAVKTKSAPAPLSVVDVGSRLGVVLWACALALQQGALIQPPSDDDEEEEEDNDEEEEEEEEEPEVHITGVEVDAGYVKVSQEVLKRFFAPRRRRAPRLDRHADAVEAAEEPMDVSEQLHLIQSNCFDGAGAEALSQASVVVLHNVFEYFSPSPVEHARCWLKLRRMVCHRGQFLVCSPSLEETLLGFTADVWAAAWSEEAAGSVVVPPLKWMAAFVERLDISEVGKNFLTMRALCRVEEGEEDQPTSDAAEDADDCGCGHDHGHGDDHGHSHNHDGHGHSHGATEENAEEGLSEVDEQIQKIFVYRVL